MTNETKDTAQRERKRFDDVRRWQVTDGTGVNTEREKKVQDRGRAKLLTLLEMI